MLFQVAVGVGRGKLHKTTYTLLLILKTVSRKKVLNYFDSWNQSGEQCSHLEDNIFNNDFDVALETPLYLI